VRPDSSRRNFLAAGLALPVAGAASVTPTPTSPSPASAQASTISGKVTYRTLGKTGLKVSTVGYGCMITSDPSVISRAVDMGINFYDTSRGYQGGQNERMVGAALGAKRKNIILSSKEDAKNKAGALKELETSLKELGTDYLDVWLLHGASTPEAISDELVDAQRTAKQQGKARFIGISTHQLPAVADRLIETKLDVVIAQYNFTSDPSWGPATEKLSKAGVGLVAMKVMAGGTRPSRRGAPKPQMQRPNAATAALKWVLKNSAIATTVPSMTDMDQLEQNFRVMGESFTEADEKILAARLEEIRFRYCRMCGKCEGQCPQGLPVSNMLRFVMYADDYGQFALGREHFLRLPAEHQSVRCDQCPTCSVQCPNGVRIAERLIRAQELFA
jgi:uncharacterized protein